MLAFQPELLLFVLLKSFFMKSLNFWRSLFFSALAAAAFGACSDDDKGGDVDASITVNDKEATTIGIASAGGETEAVSVVSSGTWTLAFESDQDWCIPNITSGKAGTSSLVFTVDPMPAGIEERSATAILTTVGMIFNVEVPVKVSVTVRQSPSGSALPETNVAAVRALLVAMNPTSTKTDVTAEIGAMTLTGIVVSNSEGKNTGSTWNMAVQDGVVAKNSGLTISSSKFQSASYTPGTCVTVALTGAQVQLYNGLLQLNIADAAAEAVKTVSTEAPEPVVIAPDALFDYESMLVQIANCYPVSGYGTAWNSGATNTGGNGGNVNFVTTEGQAFVCRTGSSAAFKDQIVPEKMGSLIGIAGRYNNDKQVSPRTLADIKLTETIPAPEYTLAKIGNITNGGNYKVENATVIATYAAGFLMQDDTGIILVYPGSAENPVAIPAVGKIVTVEGLVSPYGGVLQFGEGSKVAETGTGSVPTPPQAVEITADNIADYMTSPKVTFIKMSGMLDKSTSGDKTYYNLAFLFESIYTGSISGPNADLGLDALNGELIDVEGWFINNGNKGGTGKYFTVVATRVTKNQSIFYAKFTTKPQVFAGSSPQEQQIDVDTRNIPDNQLVEFTFTGDNADKFTVVKQNNNSSVIINAAGDNNSGTTYTATLVASYGGKTLDEIVVKQDIALAPGAKKVMMDIVSIVAAKTGTVELGSGNYGSQAVTDPSTWYTWAMNSINFTGVRITKGSGAENTYNYEVIQVQGNSTDAAKQGRIMNAASLGQISKIIVTCQNTKATSKPAFKMYFGPDQDPAINETPVSGAEGVATGAFFTFTEEFDVAGKGYSYFKLLNTGGALYIKTLEIIYED